MRHWCHLGGVMAPLSTRVKNVEDFIFGVMVPFGWRSDAIWRHYATQKAPLRHPNPHFCSLMGLVIRSATCTNPHSANSSREKGNIVVIKLVWNASWSEVIWYRALCVWGRPGHRNGSEYIVSIQCIQCIVYNVLYKNVLYCQGNYLHDVGM